MRSPPESMPIFFCWSVLLKLYLPHQHRQVTVFNMHPGGGGPPLTNGSISLLAAQTSQPGALNTSLQEQKLLEPCDAREVFIHLFVSLGNEAVTWEWYHLQQCTCALHFHCRQGSCSVPEGQEIREAGALEDEQHMCTSTTLP